MPKGQDLSKLEAKPTQDLRYHSKREMAQSHRNFQWVDLANGLKYLYGPQMFQKPNW